MNVSLNERQMDALREVGMIGSGNAATALSGLLKVKVDVRVPVVRFLGLAEVADALGGSSAPLLGIQIGITGEAGGLLLLFFDPGNALRLLDCLFMRSAGTTRELGEMEESALKEVGNILSGSYLTALSQLTGILLMPDLPRLSRDQAGPLLESASRTVQRPGEVALLIQSHLSLPSTDISMNLVLMPEEASLRVILERLGLGG